MKTVKAIYAGRRLRGEEHVTHLFYVGKKELFFKTVKHCRRGFYYEIFKEKGFQIHTSPKELGESNTTPETLAKWESAELEVENFLKRKRAANKIERYDQVKEVISSLRYFIGELDYIEKKILIEHVVNEVDRDAKKRREEKTNQRLAKVMKRLK